MCKFRKGASLGELLIVVGVVAAIALAAILVVSNIRQNARVVADKTNAQTLVNAVNAYNAVSTSKAQVRLKPALINDSTLKTLQTQLKGMNISASDTGGDKRVDLVVSLSIDDIRRALNYIDETVDSVWVVNTNGTRTRMTVYWYAIKDV